MNNIYNYSKQIHNHIISKAFHPYLRRFLYEPVIEEKKLLLLILLLQELDITDEERDQYITATMLIQTALDTHDNVTLSSVDGNPEMLKNRQLTVLAGDYYSGLYYYILAQLENINLIRSLAEGTKDINQQKIVYHQHHFTDEEALLKTIQVIESSLIVKVAECFKITSNTRFIEQFLLLNRLQTEKEKFKSNRSSYVYNMFAEILFSKGETQLSQVERSSLVSVIDEHINKIYQACVEELNVLSSTKASTLSLYKTTLLEDEWKVNSLAEEG
ncbi:heptaprenyl diphosphate synthase component 1 [Bacillus massiliigorillae]|uniref:heptaprenyl diphosphate synthase component 1 n=1 Tax=Bacillus massiliigorillae TaxID=1243664 RepID=UPI0003A7D9E8|nr:heptaprenyl diphosphate synthase component 1 [Bacillus massiliigorillae]